MRNSTDSLKEVVSFPVSVSRFKTFGIVTWSYPFHSVWADALGFQILSKFRTDVIAKFWFSSVSNIKASQFMPAEFLTSQHFYS